MPVCLRNGPPRRERHRASHQDRIARRRTARADATGDRIPPPALRFPGGTGTAELERGQLMRRAATVLLAATLAAFASAAGAMEIETAAGPVEIAERPERIAVFDIAAIDTLDGLGVKIAGVPDNLYIDALRHVGDDAETVGTLFEPDLEGLSALAPDLVIVGGRSSSQLGSVSRVAPTVDMTLFGDDLIAEARARVTTYGELFDKQDEAAGLLADL